MGEELGGSAPAPSQRQELAAGEPCTANSGNRGQRGREGQARWPRTGLAQLWSGPEPPVPWQKRLHHRSSGFPCPAPRHGSVPIAWRAVTSCMRTDTRSQAHRTPR